MKYTLSSALVLIFLTATAFSMEWESTSQAQIPKKTGYKRKRDLDEDKKMEMDADKIDAEKDLLPALSSVKRRKTSNTSIFTEQEIIQNFDKEEAILDFNDQGFVNDVQFYSTLNDDTLRSLMPSLKKLMYLTRLNLSQTDVTDEGLAQLRELEKIRNLNLFKARNITDIGLLHLQSLKHLTILNICGTQVTGAGLMYLKDLPELESIYVDSQILNDNGGYERFSKLYEKEINDFQQHRIDHGFPVVEIKYEHFI